MNGNEKKLIMAVHVDFEFDDDEVGNVVSIVLSRVLMMMMMVMEQ